LLSLESPHAAQVGEVMNSTGFHVAALIESQLDESRPFVFLIWQIVSQHESVAHCQVLELCPLDFVTAHGSVPFGVGDDARILHSIIGLSIGFSLKNLFCCKSLADKSLRRTGAARLSAKSYAARL
jgi:hypothetical protein